MGPVKRLKVVLWLAVLIAAGGRVVVALRTRAAKRRGCTVARHRGGIVYATAR